MVIFQDDVWGDFFGKSCGMFPQGEGCKHEEEKLQGTTREAGAGSCAEVCRTYDAIQYAYADLLQASDEVVEIRCNVPLDGLEVGAYTSDSVCTKADGDLMVRECICRKFLMKPLTAKLMDASRDYWLRHGVTDWGVVIDEEV